MAELPGLPLQLPDALPDNAPRSLETSTSVRSSLPRVRSLKKFKSRSPTGVARVAATSVVVAASVASASVPPNDSDFLSDNTLPLATIDAESPSASSVVARPGPESSFTFGTDDAVLASMSTADYEVLETGPAIVSQRTRTLSLGVGHEVHFLKDVSIGYVSHEGHTTAHVDQLNITASGRDVVEARAALIDLIRSKAREYLRVLSHQLTQSDRAQKRLWLSTIDPALSKLNGRSDEIWIFGRVALERDQVVFRRSGGDSTAHTIPESVIKKNKIRADGRFRFALVHADAIGRPRGPVIRLEDPLVQEGTDAWKQWLERNPT